MRKRCGQRGNPHGVADVSSVKIVGVDAKDLCFVRLNSADGDALNGMLIDANGKCTIGMNLLNTVWTVSARRKLVGFVCKLEDLLAGCVIV